MSTSHQITSYFKFLKRSTNQHGVHSPFVFDLVTKCFYNKSNHVAYKTIKDYINQLLKSNQTIDVKDLGSGSQVFKTNSRLVSKMAKVAGSSFKDAKLLYRLSNYFQFNSILELGTSLGIATHAMHLGNPKAKITTVEGCPNISTFSQNTFNNFNLNNIDLLTGDFTIVINQLKTTTFDLIYFDGNHQKEATLNYFETLLPNSHNNSVFIFDDIYWSKDMTDAWESIKKHPKVTVTIDTYHFGLVFFRKEQAKEHFTIRI
ncbi:class I SAM-dependent methyltransferase [Olleya sp. YS]|uniref:O-methyltransferase n=1 Tax=Olleya sp. YS TaxID=3028318 RepID=UPI0024341DC6|nr:class I SAM-dependent methyltransferase [Olleya sp. YS]WGD34894.1 class I SAM-dependent methyltransferase [Olleya sp. YS]